MQAYGIDAILRIMSHLVFIYMVFWSLGSLRIDALFKPMYTTQIRLAIVLFSIGIGYLASCFFLEILQLTKNLVVVGF